MARTQLATIESSSRVKKPDHDALNDCEQATLLNLARYDDSLGRQARERLIREHHEWIQTRCKSILRDNALAQDAAQEATISILRALPSFEQRASLKTWMGRIIEHECFRQIRKQKRHRLNNRLEEAIALYLEQQREESMHGDQLVSFAQVTQLLQNMSEKSRDILTLRFFGELSLSEISQTLCISLSAAKMRLYRAIEEIKYLFNRNQHVYFTA